MQKISIELKFKLKKSYINSFEALLKDFFFEAIRGGVV